MTEVAYTGPQQRQFVLPDAHRRSDTVLRVLMYHRVITASDAIGDNPSLLSASPAAFYWQVRHLAKYYHVVSAEQVLEAVQQQRPLPKRAVLLTFDDAYRDFAEVAWPILRQHRMPAVLFVPTAYPDTDQEFWWDRLAHALTVTRRSTLDRAPCGRLSLRGAAGRRAALSAWRQQLKRMPHDQVVSLVEDICNELGVAGRGRGRVLTWRELRQLASEGVTIGAHTRTHPALTHVPRDVAAEEIRGSRDDLLREMGGRTAAFSYPYGDHDDAVVEFVRQAGFELAFTCEAGFNGLPLPDALRFRRTNITRRTTPLVFGIRLSRCGEYVDRWRLAAQKQSSGRARHAMDSLAVVNRPMLHRP